MASKKKSPDEVINESYSNAESFEPIYFAFDIYKLNEELTRKWLSYWTATLNSFWNQNK